jgi:asparagine synthase (glutamine-hydrolysing)
MCGIAGYVIRESCPKEITRETLITMTRALYHRGPNDEGYFYSPKVGLGSRRLSIIDLSPAGRAPLFNETRTVAVIQNGEIYNYQELRSDLIRKGHCFVGKSDTEVIVHLYEEAGEHCFEQLDGMYAIAIWDSMRQKLFLARDRFGEKPLYYHVGSYGIAFASELKSLVLFPYFQKEIDWEALDQFLTLGYILAPHTPYRNVYKLLPGHYLVFDLQRDTFEIHEYWALPDPVETTPRQSEMEYLESFQELFSKSVQSRLVSDVPVGAFLSGGIDSSLVVATMARLRREPIQTFSIGFQFSRAHNENPVAEEVARSLGVEHHTLWVDFQDVLAVIEKLPWLWDEPLGDPALIGVYLITRFAKENGVTVMLSGDGGDELFLGYPVYTWVERLNTIYHLPAIVRKGLTLGVSSASWILHNNRLEKAARGLKQPNLLRAAYYLTGYGSWSVEEVGQLRGGVPNIENSRFASAFNNTASHLLYCEARALLVTYLPDNNLARMDRASMANAVETRAPFLNPQIAEFSMKLPLEMKIRGPVLKYLLRKALAGFVPMEIVARPKHGFDALPMAAWLRNELRFLIDEYLDPVRLKRQGIFQPQVVETVVKQHMTGGRFNHWWKLWQLIVLQMWLERWVGI